MSATTSSPSVQPSRISGLPAGWLLVAAMAILIVTQLRLAITNESGQSRPHEPASETVPAVTSASNRTAAGSGDAPVVSPKPAPRATPASSATSHDEPVTTSDPESTTSRGAVPGRGRQSYHFRSILDYAAGKLDVVETLNWTNLAPEAAAWIDLSVLAAHADAFQLTGPVTVDGMPAVAEFADYDTNLRVEFADAVTLGEEVSIVLPFRLWVRENLGSLGGSLTGRDGTLQFGHWFPIWSTVHGFNQVGDSQISWNAESIVLDLTSTTSLGINAVAGTGRLMPGATRSHWLFAAEDVRDFAFAVDPDFQMATATTKCDGQQIEIRAYDGSSARGMLRKALRAIDRYGEWYGCYSYPTFSIVRAGSPLFSMEFPTLVFMGRTVAHRTGVVYHEVAHQWWFGIVGNDQMSEPWLDEAFAEYSAQTLLGSRDSFRSTRDIDETIYDFAAWSGRDEYVDTIYDRGAEFLRKVHRRMGDRAFYTATRAIVSTYRHDVATADGVLDIFRASTTESLDDLFAEYGLYAEL